MAAMRDSEQCLEILLSNGAEINIPCNVSNMFYFLKSYEKRVEIIWKMNLRENNMKSFWNVDLHRSTLPLKER